MTTSKILIRLLLAHALVIALPAPTAFAQNQVTLVQQIIALEKRFAEALRQKDPKHFPSQKVLWRDTQKLYDLAIQSAIQSGDMQLIEACARLAALVVDNDPTNSGRSKLYSLYKTHKSKTKIAINKLNPEDTDKLIYELNIAQKDFVWFQRVSRR